MHYFYNLSFHFICCILAPCNLHFGSMYSLAPSLSPPTHSLWCEFMRSQFQIKKNIGKHCELRTVEKQHHCFYAKLVTCHTECDKLVF